MSRSEKILVVLVETRELKPVFEGWPLDMCLAICLLSDGECRLVLFHENEFRAIVPRLTKNLRLSAQDICVVPRVDGYATQALHFSDQSRLMRLVADQPGLVDEAADYSVNYRYALEEGLAPERLMGMVDDSLAPEAVSRAASNATPPAKVDASPILPEAVDISSAPPTLPGFLRRPKEQALGHPLPGPGFRSASQIGADDAAVELFQISAEKDDWIEIVKPGCEGSELTLENPENIFLRQDGKVIALAREQSSLRFQVPPTRVRIKASVLPKRMRGLLGDCIGQVEVNKTGDFIFLQLKDRNEGGLPGHGSEIETAPRPDLAPEFATTRPEKKPARKQLVSAQNALLAAVAVALFGVLGVLLLDSSNATVAQDSADQDVNWQRYQLSQNLEPIR